MSTHVPRSSDVPSVHLVIAIDKTTGEERPEIGFDVFFQEHDADRAAHSANCVTGPHHPERQGVYYRVASFDRRTKGP